MTNEESPYKITVNVEPFYIEDQSAPDQNRYVFAYTVNIRNNGRAAAKLVSRHWIITDANGKMFVQLRYGSKPLELAKGMNAVSVQNLNEVPEIIGSIIEAINAGELDPQLTAAIAERKANFKPKTKKAAA